MNTDINFEPRIIGFLCNWCSYAGADKAGTNQNPYPANVNVIRVMCSGRVDPHFILEALRRGADGVIILGCHLGDCHYKEGNYRATERYHLLKKMINQFGIDEKRVLLDYVSAGEADKYVKLITEYTKEIQKLGPLNYNTKNTESENGN